jgi:hypothetical protein
MFNGRIQFDMKPLPFTFDSVSKLHVLILDPPYGEYIEMFRYVGILGMAIPVDKRI